MIQDLIPPVRDCADPFVHDIIIPSGTGDMTGDKLIEAHEKDLHRPLRVLDKHSMVCKPTQASVFVREVAFAGHLVGHGQRSPMPEKLAALRHWKRRQNHQCTPVFHGILQLLFGIDTKVRGSGGASPQDDTGGQLQGHKGSKKKLAWTTAAGEAFDELKEQVFG